MGKPLDANWHPTDAEIMYGLGLGLTTQAISDIAEDMALWAAANANRQVARKENWSAAFKSWMRREAAKRGRNGTKSTNPTMDAFDRIINSTAGGGEPNGAGAKDITGRCSEAGQATDWTVATRKSAESPSLFAWDNENLGKVSPRRG